MKKITQQYSIFGPGNDAQIEFINSWEAFKRDNPSPKVV